MQNNVQKYNLLSFTGRVVSASHTLRKKYYSEDDAKTGEKFINVMFSLYPLKGSDFKRLEDP